MPKQTHVLYTLPVWFNVLSWSITPWRCLVGMPGLRTASRQSLESSSLNVLQLEWEIMSIVKNFATFKKARHIVSRLFLVWIKLEIRLLFIFLLSNSTYCCFSLHNASIFKCLGIMFLSRFWKSEHPNFLLGFTYRCTTLPKQSRRQNCGI